MNRIEKITKLIKNSGNKMLIAYITGGVPDIEGTIEYFRALEEGGANIIEIGIPFSDALADGPVNQEAAHLAIKEGIGVKDIFGMIKSIRKFSETPVVFLVYFNTVFYFGSSEFIKECKTCGVDGLVIPDLPLEERDEILEYINKEELCLIPLVAPTSQRRVKKIVSGMRGFTYCVSSMGVTGERKKFREDIASYIGDVKKNSKLPVAVGFGISDAAAAAFFYNLADGIIVGSAIVKRILEGKTPDQIKKFVNELCYKITQV